MLFYHSRYKRLHQLAAKAWPIFWTIAGFIALSLMYNPDAHSQEHKQVRVGIVDTGMDAKDPRFAPWICDEGSAVYDATGGKPNTSPHMTHVAGTIRALGGESHAYCLALCRFFDENGTGESNANGIVACFRWMKSRHVDIVNMSGGGGGYDENELRAIKDLGPKVHLLFAAGNGHRDISIKGQGYYPASYRLPNAEVIGALESETVLLPSSNRGDGVVTSYLIGKDVYSTFPSGTYAILSGTSMSTALASGLRLRAMLDLPAVSEKNVASYVRAYWELYSEYSHSRGR